MLNTRVYVDRRAVLKSQFKSGVALFLGNIESPMNYSANTFPFRQDSTFLYYLGLDSAGLAAIVDFDKGTETVFGDDITVEDIVWMGPQTPLAERCREVGVGSVRPSADLETVLADALADHRQVHFLPPYRPENVIKIQHLLGIHAAKAKQYASVDLIRAVAAQRSVKAAEEIEQIEQALEITREMHLTAMRMTRPGLKESDIAGAIEGVALSREVHVAFPVILTVHGETLHNPFHGNLLKEGGMVLNDSGAESKLHYAADITRTFPVTGLFTPQQRTLYQIILDAQEAALQAMKPGKRFLDVHLLACLTLAKGLKEMKLMRGDLDEAVRAGAHALFFQCGLGHMMGLDVHDMEDIGEAYVGYDETVQRNKQFGICYLRMAKALQPGYVMTVEPGLYFIPALIDQWKSENRHAEFINYKEVDHFRQIGGLRVEDDVLVTNDGIRMLGEPIPKTIDEMETAMSGD